MADRNDLPSPGASNFGQRVRETLMTYLGRQGDPLDRGLTLRDLIDAGVVKIRAGMRLGLGSGTLPIEPAIEGGSTFTPEEPDLTPPPAPTGFAVTAALTNIFIEHDAPTYEQGHGHLRTRVYGKIVNEGDPTPTFADAAEIGQFTGTTYAHPSDPATTWRLWIKWETVDGVLSVAPAGGTNGLAATTGQDVTRLLDALTGAITEGQLFNDLAGRIDLIDGDDTLEGSVAARIKVEQSARTTADAANTTLITQVQARLDTGDYAAVKTESSATANKVTGLEAKYTVKIDLAGHVSGYGLLSTANTGTPTSEFGVRADKFFIAPPSTVSATAPTTSLYKGRAWLDTSVTPNVTRYYTGEDWSTTPQALPFVVLSSPTTIDGQVVPAGVYINGAYIQGGTIDGAAIKGGTIEGTKLINVSADKITGAALLETSYIESYNYASGVTGWKIGGDDSAEFNNVTVRGTVYSAAGEIGGNVLGATFIRSDTYTENSEGWKINSGGAAEFNNIKARGVTIYNDAGGVILSSGSGVPKSAVSGLGAFAGLDSITTSNASTYIADGAIGSAQIGTLTAGDIDTRNLTIKDANGKVVLSANTTLDFVQYKTWDFNNSGEGWITSSSVSPTLNPYWISIATTGSGPVVQSPTFSLVGAQNTLVRVRIRRTGGSGWNGGVYYATTGHGFSESYVNRIVTDPTTLNKWVVVEWDMAALSNGGSDWINNTITQIRFDFGVGPGDNFDVDWVAIGRVGPLKLDGTNISTYIAALSVDTLRIAGEAVLVPRTYEDATDYNAGGTVMTYTFTVPQGGKIIVLWQGQMDTGKDFVIRAHLNTAPGAAQPAGYYLVGFGNGDYEYDAETYSYFYVGTGKGSYVYRNYTPAPPDIGNTRAGGDYDDAPMLIGFGTALAGSNTLYIYFQRNGWGTLTYQRLIILGAQR